MDARDAEKIARIARWYGAESIDQRLDAVHLSFRGMSQRRTIGFARVRVAPEGVSVDTMARSPCEVGQRWERRIANAVGFMGRQAVGRQASFGDW